MKEWERDMYLKTEVRFFKLSKAFLFLVVKREIYFVFFISCRHTLHYYIYILDPRIVLKIFYFLYLQSWLSYIFYSYNIECSSCLVSIYIVPIDNTSLQAEV